MDDMKVGTVYYIRNSGNEEFLAEVIEITSEYGEVTSVVLRNDWTTRDGIYTGKIMFFTKKHPISRDVIVYEIQDKSEIMMVKL